MPHQELDIEAIFTHAVAMASLDERRAYLAESCQGDEHSRNRIEALLRASDDAGSFLETPPEDFPATIAGAELDTCDAAATEISLDFLKPSDKPNCLGTLGQYEVLNLVGRGGMGIVLRAYDTKLSRVVAIKAMAPELAANPSAVKRFLREARAAAAVSHEHVVTIHAIEEAHRPPFIVMEYIDGQSLQDKIDSTGGLELKETLRIGLQIARGLSAAHEQGLVHRDIKPANILLENGVERVKITDFGLARAVDDVSVTQTGQIAGTPQFMSPEQANGEAIDARSDLFSLGSVLYTMCAGHPPFRGESAVAMLRRVTDDEPRSLRDMDSDVPDWLDAIVSKLLEKQPDQRFQSASEVADVIGRCLSHLQQPDRVAVPPVQPPNAAAPLTSEASSPLPDGLKGPLRALTVNAGLAMVPMYLVVSLFNAMRWPLESWISSGLVIGSFVSMIHAVLLLIAVDRTRRLASYRWAVTAVVLGFCPVSILTIVTCPLAAIWMLSALQIPSVRKALGRPARPVHYDEQRRLSTSTLLLVLIPLLVAITFSAAATIYIATDRGTLIVETHDPGLRVVVEDNGERVKIVDTGVKRQGHVRVAIILRSGRYELRPFGDERILLSKNSITVKRGDRVIVRVRSVDDATAAIVPEVPHNSELLAIRTSAGTYWRYESRDEPVLTDSRGIGFNESFVLEWQDDRRNRVYLRTMSDEFYLKGIMNSEDVLIVSKDKAGSELFQVDWLDREARTFRLRNRDGYYVRAKTKGRRLDTVRFPDETSVFTFEELPASLEPSDSPDAATQLVGKWRTSHDPTRPELVHRFEFLENGAFKELSPVLLPNAPEDAGKLQRRALPFRASGVWSIDGDILRLDTTRSNVKTTTPIEPRLLRIAELTDQQVILVLVQDGEEGERATWVREE